MTTRTAPTSDDPGGASIDRATGTWDIWMRTPIGTMRAVLVFSVDDGTVRGRASGKSEEVPLRHLRVEGGDEGDRVIWTQSVTKPMRLELAFDISVLGHQMTGHSRAGRLQQSTVSGAPRPN